MTQKSDHVTAFIGGKQCVVCLRREVIESLECALNDSAYAVFRRFGRGHWTVNEVRTILNFALLEDGQVSHLKKMIAFGFANVPVARHPLVDHVLETNPQAPYAVLALRCLEAALFGISPEFAVFDERDDDAAASAA
ncbi:GTA-gp10 family protein [Xanthobacter sp. DSM 24535]|uniref:GTA-gp10 family protein n=1 Tax=Roseixanthobacter psychrophilus TaxID=3119917 RepID=UPI003726C35A